MPFPRLINYKFEAKSTHILKSQETGRVDKVANKVYEYTQMYKPIMWMNNISLGIGMRAGIRPQDEAIANELSIKNKQLKANVEAVQEISLQLTPNQYWWNSYGDLSNGYLCDLTTGDVLLMPTFESGERWLRNYQFINESEETPLTNSDNFTNIGGAT